MSTNDSASSWKIDSDSVSLVPLATNTLHFTGDQTVKIRQGFVPKSMDDRWFIFYELGKLYIHNSWSGKLVYCLVFKEVREELTLIEGFLNTSAFVSNEVIDLFKEYETAIYVLRRILLCEDYDTPSIKKRKERNQSILAKLQAEKNNAK